VRFFQSMPTVRAAPWYVRRAGARAGGRASAECAYRRSPTVLSQRTPKCFRGNATIFVHSVLRYAVRLIPAL